MRTITKNVYTFDELSAEAKEKALQEYNENRYDYFCDDDYLSTLNRIMERFGVPVKDWSIGLGCGGNWIELKDDYDYYWDGEYSYWEIPMTPIRLAKWFQNRGVKPDEYGCYDICGMYTDRAYDETMKEVMTFHIKYVNCLKDVFEDIFHLLCKYWEEDREYEQSMDFLEEEADANGWEFYADGTRY